MKQKSLLRFLPVLAAPGFVPGAFAGGQRSEDGSLPAIRFANSSELDAFVQALYDNGWIISFDWPAWATVAERYVREPARLHDADYATIRKLFTTHVRAER